MESINRVNVSGNTSNTLSDNMVTQYEGDGFQEDFDWKSIFEPLEPLDPIEYDKKSDESDKSILDRIKEFFTDFDQSSIYF